MFYISFPIFTLETLSFIAFSTIASCVFPPSIKNNEATLNQYNVVMEHLQTMYSVLQKQGIPNEDARYVLPNACETTLEFTCNGRELIHCMNERLCTRAQWEIRALFTAMKHAVAEHDEQCAEFAKFLVPKCEAHGLDKAFCTEHKSCGRHATLKEVFEGYKKSLSEDLPTCADN